jgi:tripartite-type tricarboxylate transporter receptor subunit TctC
MRRWLGLLIAAFLALGWSLSCAAQDYPTRPMTMIVPFPAGGATDTVARFLGEKMRAILGQPVGGLYALQFDLLKDLEPVIQIGA